MTLRPSSPVYCALPGDRRLVLVNAWLPRVHILLLQPCAMSPALMAWAQRRDSLLHQASNSRVSSAYHGGSFPRSVVDPIFQVTSTPHSRIGRERRLVAPVFQFPDSRLCRLLSGQPRMTAGAGQAEDAYSVTRPRSCRTYRQDRRACHSVGNRRRQRGRRMYLHRGKRAPGRAGPRSSCSAAREQPAAPYAFSGYRPGNHCAARGPCLRQPLRVGRTWAVRTRSRAALLSNRGHEPTAEGCRPEEFCAYAWQLTHSAYYDNVAQSGGVVRTDSGLPAS